MKIKAVLFDLDGTLLPMEQEDFVREYLTSLVGMLVRRGLGEKDKLKGAIWQGIEAMRANDGVRTNEDVFWEKFIKATGVPREKSEPVLESYYREYFSEVGRVCGYQPNSKRVIDKVHECGMLCVLATNPMFPRIATAQRIEWAGLCTTDFNLYTTYEDFRYSKPSVGYYRQILDMLGLLPEECLMVGNDVDEDMIVTQIGMKTFLLTDCLINKKDKDISVYKKGGFDELIDYIEILNCEY